MNSFVGFLRGVNVGKVRIKMAELKQELEKANLQNVSTYIQSGNIRFQAESSSTQELEQIISDVILENFSYSIPTLVLDQHDLAQRVREYPFEGEEKYRHLTFLLKESSTADFSKIEAKAKPSELWEIKKQTIYLYLPLGYGTTDLHNMLWEKELKVSCTTRNWNTCLEMIK